MLTSSPSKSIVQLQHRDRDRWRVRAKRKREREREREHPGAGQPPPLRRCPFLRRVMRVSERWGEPLSLAWATTHRASPARALHLSLPSTQANQPLVPHPTPIHPLLLLRKHTPAATPSRHPDLAPLLRLPTPTTPTAAAPILRPPRHHVQGEGGRKGARPQAHQRFRDGGRQEWRARVREQAAGGDEAQIVRRGRRGRGRHWWPLASGMNDRTRAIGCKAPALVLTLHNGGRRPYGCWVGSMAPCNACVGGWAGRNAVLHSCCRRRRRRRPQGCGRGTADPEHGLARLRKRHTCQFGASTASLLYRVSVGQVRGRLPYFGPYGASTASLLY